MPLLYFQEFTWINTRVQRKQTSWTFCCVTSNLTYRILIWLSGRCTPDLLIGETFLTGETSIYGIIVVDGLFTHIFGSVPYLRYVVTVYKYNFRNFKTIYFIFCT